jgi:hypothetical protein
MKLGSAGSKEDEKTGVRGRMWKFIRYQVGVWGHVKELEERRRRRGDK